MPTTEELRKIGLIDVLSDRMLETIAPLAETLNVDQDGLVFEQGDQARYFYLLAKGKVLLNMMASETVCISVMSAEPGDCFGWSALLGGRHYNASAVCVEKSLLYVIDGQSFLKMLQAHQDMGFRVMTFAARAINRRLERRTGQLFKILLENFDLVCRIREESL